jgi:hypothetical protein
MAEWFKCIATFQDIDPPQASISYTLRPRFPSLQDLDVEALFGGQDI